jgi:phosphate transport system protein
MTHSFEHELDTLQQRLLTMGSHAQAAVGRAVKALLDRNDDHAWQVKEDDRILDELEMEVDELAVALLAKAPLATNLRLITVAMKISQNLERIGDEATTIARRALALNALAQIEPTVDLPSLTAKSLALLKDALSAFLNRDAAQALAVVPRDKEVDVLNRQIQHELTDHMVADREAIPRCLHLMVVAKSLERVADHATNIAEEAVFLFEGRDVRHSLKSANDRPPHAA